MWKLIQDLYYLECERLPRDTPTKEKLEKDEEWQTYQKLRKKLSGKDKELFDAYEELYGERHIKQMEDFYGRGFKRGFFFALELYNFGEK